MQRESFAFRVGATGTLTIAALGSQATTLRVSVDSAGSQALGDSGRAAISGNGRYVAFESYAENLVPGDMNQFTDVFVHDLATGSTELVNLTAWGTQPNNAASGTPSISADGRIVAFETYAGLVVPFTGSSHVYARDRLAGVTVRVSADSNGIPGDHNSGTAAVSADGRFVAFYSSATNLVAGDTNAHDDVFVHELATGQTTRVSVDDSGGQILGDSTYAALSADGRYVAFESIADGLVPGDTNGRWDVFVHDRQTGQNVLASVGWNGAQGNAASNSASLSADGQRIAFKSWANNLVPGDTNAFADVFLRDLTTGVTSRVSVSSLGVQGNRRSTWPRISGDGLHVAFWSSADNLVVGDTNAVDDVFVHDTVSGLTTRASVGASGAQGEVNSTFPAISFDGRFVVFETHSAGMLLTPDTNGANDVFLRDRGATSPQSFCTAGTTSNACVPQLHASAQPSVTFANACDLVVANVEGQRSGLFLYGVDNTGFTPTAWGTGFVCVRAPMQRTGAQSSGGTLSACDGALTLDWNGYQQSHSTALGQPWSVGMSVFVQAWFRDPIPPLGSNRSDAVELTYTP